MTPNAIHWSRTGRNPKLDIALDLEKIALEDEYFVKRRLYPNVDFYSGIIYQAMGFKPNMFTVLFAIPRVAGWLAHWEEMLSDPDTKIYRPRQVYTGQDERHLPENQRRALVLKRFAGLSYQEIGEEMGLSPQAVDGLLKRARQFLKKALQEYLE